MRTPVAEPPSRRHAHPDGEGGHTGPVFIKAAQDSPETRRHPGARGSAAPDNLRDTTCLPFRMHQTLPLLARQLAFSLLLSSLVSGCMVVPHTTRTYNAECNVIEKRVTLESQQVQALGQCRGNAECTGLLAGYGLLAVGSVVVSGGVAVVGNVAYWLEERAQCLSSGSQDQDKGKPAAAAASAAVAAAT